MEGVVASAEIKVGETAIEVTVVIGATESTEVVTGSLVLTEVAAMEPGREGLAPRR
jgi:hypothetical protein